MNNKEKLPQLHETWLFRLSYAVPLLVAIITFLISVDFSFIWVRSGDGLEFFVSRYKYSLAAIGFIPALMGLVAINYRSIQLNIQTDITTTQNEFTNYFKHREEFNNQLKTIEEELNITFSNSNELYKDLFPNNSMTHLNVVSEGTDKEDEPNLKIYIDQLKKMNNEFQGCTETTPGKVKDFYIKLITIASDLHIKIPNKNGWRLKREPENSEYRNTVIRFSPIDELAQAYLLNRVIIQLANFCQLNELAGVRVTIGTSNFRKLAHLLFEEIIDYDKKVRESKEALERELSGLKIRCNPIEELLGKKLTDYSSHTMEERLRQVDLHNLMNEIIIAAQVVQKSYFIYTGYSSYLDMLESESAQNPMGENKWVAKSIWNDFEVYAKHLYQLIRKINRENLSLNKDIYEIEAQEALMYSAWYESNYKSWKIF